ncbi:PaaI family thioesterase [Roseibium aggregatum]|nr:PaaI family thioesterase [Roseibium aggregatum]
MTGDASEDGRAEENGWKELKIGGFMDRAGPLLAQRRNGSWIYGLHTDESHTNPAGVLHGGVTASLVDHAIAMVAWEATGRVPCVTVQVDLRYLEAAKAGDRLEARVAMRHRTKSLLFLDADVTVSGKAIASASAVMKPIRRTSAPVSDQTAEKQDER